MSGRRASLAAGALFALALAEVLLTVVAGVASGIGFSGLLEGFALSNATIGLSLAVAGWLIAWHRPRNPVGWLLLAGGICYATSAAGYALLAAGTEPGADAPGWRLLATVTNGAWPAAISFFIPVTLLLFPDGRLPGRHWRWLVALAAVGTLAFVAEAVVPVETLSRDLGVAGYPSWAGASRLGWVPWIVTAGSLVYAAVPVALILRYRRGDERVRRQLLWLLFAVLVMLTGFTLSDLFGYDSWLNLFAIALVPLSITVAVLRYQLLDIRLVVSRSVLYLLLTAGVVGAYLALVAALDATVRRQVGLGSSVLATLLIAAVFHPARVWLQRRLDRAFYGARQDPVRAVAEVGARLGEVGSGTGLDGVLEALCRVLRLPAAAILAGGVEVARHGELPPARHAVALRQGDDRLGELVVGLRRGESRLGAADEQVLGLLAAPLAVAVHATTLAVQLGQSRERLVAAREEERRRLRRDLHDGLGPALTGVVLKADAARRLAPSDPDRAVRLLAELREETTAAVSDIRRLVEDLRPPALDSLGLVGALRAQAATLPERADGGTLSVTVEAPATLAELPAAAEVAAYRIATEALTNVLRHSTASAATVTIAADAGTLRVWVRDNGGNGDSNDSSDASNGHRPWRPGVGLTSMRERAAELGGALEAGPGEDGGLVTVSIPLGAR